MLDSYEASHSSFSRQFHRLAGPAVLRHGPAFLDLPPIDQLLCTSLPRSGSPLTTVLCDNKIMYNFFCSASDFLLYQEGGGSMKCIKGTLILLAHSPQSKLAASRAPGMLLSRFRSIVRVGANAISACTGIVPDPTKPRQPVMGLLVSWGLASPEPTQSRARRLEFLLCVFRAGGATTANIAMAGAPCSTTSFRSTTGA